MQLSVRQNEFLQSLSQTQVISLDQLQSYQRTLLEPLVRHARVSVPFYRDRLEAVFTKHDTLDWSRWHEIPILGGKEARDAGPDLQTENLPEGNDRWFEQEKPASTFAPLRRRRSSLTNLASRCQIERAFHWWGMDVDQTFAFIGHVRDGDANPPEGLNLGTWSMTGDGSFVALDMRNNVEQQVQWLQQIRPRYLLTYPSLLHELANYVLASGRIGLWFDKVMTTGEPLSTEVRVKTQKAFGAAIFDRYGAQEVGHIAAECPSCRQYHIAAESVLIEVLDDDGTLTKPGHIGRVIATSFYNYAMPFIRYDIGDLAEVSWSNTCLRRLPSLTRILGPMRNVFTKPDGSRVLPELDVAKLRQFLDFVDVQVVQRSPEEIELRYIPAEPNREPDKRGFHAVS
jgi:phenylacetate-CoA ligase